MSRAATCCGRSFIANLEQSNLPASPYASETISHWLFDNIGDDSRVCPTPLLEYGPQQLRIEPK
jgi:hypothetical protein